jgi:SAM-dependent methyltransferase
MKVSAWIKQPVGSLLDVGCNVGAWLTHCTHLYSSARLAGVEINPLALAVAKKNVPSAELHHASAEKMPFPDGSFDYVTCVEVLEHLPAELRPAAFREMRRVLRPGGRLILTVPHAGWFAWFDPNNVRLRLPRLYRWLVREGRRDAVYTDFGREIEWHHHFTVSELKQLAGEGWRTVAVGYGGLFVYPLMAWLSWPFYRLGREAHPVRLMFERVAERDYQINFGPASYGVLLALERVDTDCPSNQGLQKSGAATLVSGIPSKSIMLQDFGSLTNQISLMAQNGLAWDDAVRREGRRRRCSIQRLVSPSGTLFISSSTKTALGDRWAASVPIDRVMRFPFHVTPKAFREQTLR